MGPILVRYAEVGLKSKGVRSRFETILRDNIISRLAHDQVEAIVQRGQARVLVETEQVERAVQSLLHVFGVASVSITESCGSDMEDMRRTVAEYSRQVLSSNSTFKVEARRAGSHPYTSMEAAASLGEAVLMANEDRGVRVDVHRPDKVIFLEVKDSRAYLFSEYHEGPGGLPLGSQGRVLALVRNERDALAAWMVMKRGCRAIVVAEEDSPPVQILRRWDPELRAITPGELESQVQRYKAMALVSGASVEDLDNLGAIKSSVPVFYPLVGMGEDEISHRLHSIKQ